MSSAHDAHAAADHDAHDAHDAHAFDGEPIQALPADEPLTPGWLPLVGAALFVVAITAFLASRVDTGASPQAPQAAAHAPEAPAAAAAAAPATAAADGTARQPAARRLSPEQLEALRKRMEQSKRGAGAATGAPAPARGPAPGGH